MSTVIVKRPPRRPAPDLPAGEIILDPPPEIPQAPEKAWSRILMGLPMIAGACAMALMMAGGRGVGGNNTIMYVAGGLFGVSMLGMVAMQFFQGGGQSKQDLINLRRDYMRNLAQQRRKVRRTVRQQREGMYYRHPDPDALWSTAFSQRLWERAANDGDFAVVRIGVGPQELSTPLIPPQSKPLEDLEPMSAAALRRFMTTYAVVPSLPVAMALNGFSRVYVQGDPDQARALTRAMLVQIATFHAPDNMLVAVCPAPERLHLWEWAKWLPHALHPEKTDALGQLRLVAPTITTLEAILDDILATRPRFNANAASPQVPGPHVVVVLDGGDVAGSDHVMTEGGVEGVTILDMSNRPPRLLDRAALVLDIDPAGKLHSATMDGRAEVGVPDTLGIIEAEGVARQLAPLRLSQASRGGDDSMSAELGLTDLLNLGDPYEFDTARAWQPRPNRDRLRVPLGLGPDGTPVEIDLKESAQDGMGPHGLLIGATGSGKSELLRTLVLALACTHPSETLNMVLTDFKGGATFTKLDRLPHTSAVITNLADEIALVDRMTDAINGELIRRQELLRKAGNFSSQRDYEKARAAGAPLAPLPSLLIICDEFSELLTAKPDFIDMFVQIGRVGRSLGVHLLLASQRLEEGRLRGLDTHLSYRIGLRTFSAMESRVVLGVPDAYELPRSPGHGYMKSGTEPLIRFKAAYVSGVYRQSAAVKQAKASDIDRVLDYTTHYLAPREEVKEKAPEVPAEVDDEAVGESVLDILVGRLEGRGTPAHQVWLPPLKEPPTIDQLLPPLAADPSRGLTVSHPDLCGALQAAVGVVDKPFEQRRDLLWLDLAGSAGHVVVVGGPQSGKSTLARTLITSMALCHTPREAQFYCLDFGGGGLNSLADLPHVGGVAGRRDVNGVRRTIQEMSSLLNEREQRFSQHGIDSMATFRRLQREGRQAPDGTGSAAVRTAAADPFGDVFLIVDGWLTLRNTYEDLEALVTEIATRGLSYGIHVVVTTTRWMDLRPAIRDLFGTRLELRLGDPSDSAIDRRAAINVPERAPGRGITPESLHFLSALPRIDGRQDAGDVAEGATKLVRSVAEAWSAPGAPAVRLLPAKLPYEALPQPGQDTKRGIPIGIAESDLQPVYVDFDGDPHFLLFGDAECGKSTFLRAVGKSIVERNDPTQARIIVVDYRRSLLGAIDSEHLIGYGSSSQVTTDIANEVASVMQKRLPGPDITPEQLRNRSWWSGPDLYVLIDDYDLVAGGHSNPLEPLLEYLAQARDIGLHVIVTRRSGGAGRAIYERFLMRMRELGSPGMVMSGERDEGALLGNVRPQALPPGRGWLVTRRGGARLIQLAHLPPQV